MIAEQKQLERMALLWLVFSALDGVARRPLDSSVAGDEYRRLRGSLALGIYMEIVAKEKP